MFDLAVVGAGIVGLGHAFAGARAGLRVVILDREARSVGASVRNFGLITVTGQSAGDAYRRAARSRDLWAAILPRAGITALQQGLFIAARREEALDVLETYTATGEGAACEVVGAERADEAFTMLKRDGLLGGLWSPHEIRIEPREAIPLLTDWLVQEHGVQIMRPVHVYAAGPGRLETSAGPVRASRIILCPGDDLRTLYGDRLAAQGVTRTKLHMMRLAPQSWRSPAAFMSDLTLVRYGGFAALPEAAPLRQRLERECGRALDAGIHVIVAQSADGSLVVGDSHHDGDPPSPFNDCGVDDMILKETDAFLTLDAAAPIEQWTGTYAKRPGGEVLVEALDRDLRLVAVTSGTGMSVSFALAEEVMRDLLGEDVPEF